MRCPNTPFATRLSGSAKETQLRLRSIFQWKKQRPPVWLFSFIVLMIFGCFGLVSCEEREVTMPDLPQTEQPREIYEEVPEQEAEYRVWTDELTDLTLDDVGEGDDSVEIQSRILSDHQEYEVTMQVTLGADMGVLNYSWSDPAYPELFRGRLTDRERDSIVVQLQDITSTYLAADTYVFDVVGDELVQRLQYNGVYGTSVQPHGDGTLDALHLARLVDKWHQPEICSATWDGEQFQIIGSGYAVDRYHLGTYAGVNGQSADLILLPRCIIARDPMIYDEVSIITHLDGESVLYQTIDPDDYGGFLASGPTVMWPVEVDDINFDGYNDFGILCDDSYDLRHAWFVWDEQKKQFVYFNTFCDDLTVNDTVWQLREIVRIEDAVNHYSVSYTGKLIPLSGAQAYDGAFGETAALFRDVMRTSRPATDAYSGQPRYIHYFQPPYEPKLAMVAKYFSVVDLDRDGMPEVVLWNTYGGNEYVGFDILRYENGEIVVYESVYRGMMGLKQDGTFSFSSGAFDNGFGRVASFGPEGYETENITWCRSAGNGTEFFVDGRPAGADKFDAARARQDEKPDVVWYEMTLDHIEVLGGAWPAGNG